MSRHDDEILGLLGAGFITGLAMLPFVLAFDLLRWSFSSKETLIFSLVVVGAGVLWFETKDLRKELGPPLGPRTELQSLPTSNV